MQKILQPYLALDLITTTLDGSFVPKIGEAKTATSSVTRAKAKPDSIQQIVF